jgi:chromosome segregation ATPase
MTRAKKMLVVLIVATLGIWGCTQGPSPNSPAGLAERVKALEAKNSKLEDDFRAAAAARDQVRKKLAAAEEQERVVQQEKQSVEQQIETLTRERDELKQQITQRTSERDQMVTQYEQFRKNIRDLLGQAEAGIAKPAQQPVTSAAAVVPADHRN